MKKITLDRELFYSKISKAVKFIPESAVIPAFEDFLIEAKEGFMDITASNGAIQIKMSCGADVIEPVSVCIPAKILVKTVALLRENEITLSVKEKNIEVKSGKSKYKITVSTMPEHFPKMTMDNLSFEINTHQLFLKNAIRRAVKFSASDASTSLSGVNLNHINGKLIITGATRAYMCRNVVRPISIINWVPITIPTETADRMVSMLDDKGEISIAHSGHGGKVQMFNDVLSPDHFIISSVLNAAKYPNTEMLFSKPQKDVVLLNTLELKDAVKRLSLYSSKDIPPQFNIRRDENEIILTSEDVDSGRTGEEITTVFNHEQSANITKSFNSQYLIDILSVIETELVELWFNNETKEPSFIIPRVENEDERVLGFLLGETTAINKPQSK